MNSDNKTLKWLLPFLQNQKWKNFSIGDRIFYAFFSTAILSFLYSIVSKKYFATEFLSRYFNIHVFSETSKAHVELLIWTLVISGCQFYRYYGATLSLYDLVTVKDERKTIQLAHWIFQLSVSIFFFLAALVLASTLFQALYTMEIMEELNVNIGILFSNYLPLLNLQWLILYFLLLDLFLLLLISNYLRCSACKEGITASAIKRNRKDVRISLVCGGILFSIHFILLNLPNEKTTYVTGNYGREIQLLVIILFLQILYSGFEVYRKFTEQ